MSIYRRDDVLPEWEPVPWDMKGDAADAQEREFHQRAMKPIEWQKVLLGSFPSEGIFGYDRDWFSSNDIAFFASFGGEDLLLIEHVWFGWPDPPQWGLASRPTGRADIRWSSWGSFPDLPAAWTFPMEPGVSSPTVTG